VKHDDQTPPPARYSKIREGYFNRLLGDIARMARTLVTITLVLWGIILMLSASIIHNPSLALLPLYGLYPGQATSGGPNYHPAEMNAWAVGAGIVFLVLGLLGMIWKSKPAAITFMVLFVLSIVVVIAKFSKDLRDLH
jgi:phosphatidylglycerophosphate synthase